MDINTLSKIPKTLYTRIVSGRQGNGPASAISSILHIPQLSDQAIKEEGKNEQAINAATKKEEDKQTVNNLIKQSNRCIISVSGVFPWDFFPDTVVVEESRVTITYRQMLGSQSHTVDIKDISTIDIQSSPFFSTIEIVSHAFADNTMSIGHINPKDATKLKTIIEGLRTFVEHNIDTSGYEIKELISKIEEFHKDKTIKG